MNKNIVMTHDGMLQDMSQSKFPNNFYFEGKNIRIMSEDDQSNKAVTNNVKNSFLLEIPTITIDYLNDLISYNDKTLEFDNLEIPLYGSSQSGIQTIIGHSVGKDKIVLFTTDDNGFDCVWTLDIKSFDLTLLYLRDLNFSINTPIQALINYENNRIEKVYWVDGINQMRFINIKHSVDNGDNEELIDIESSLISVVGDFKFSQPEIIGKEQGGIHTAGMIQYAYVLYRLNGSTTKLSPLSELESLDNGENGGGLINSTVTSYPVVKIPFIDQDYTNLKLYSIKYTSYNELPEIRLILDKNIQNTEEVIYYDTGSIISTLSLEEFSFLGNNTIYIPKHINTKFNRLFSANYEEKSFDVDLDTRVYSFPINSTSKYLHSTLTYDETTNVITGDNNYLLNTSTINNVPKTHNCLNDNFDLNAYKINSTILGGTGRYLSWELNRSEVGVGVNDISEIESEGKFFKDREIYRLGIQFYNKKAQISLPKWITDFKVAVKDDESNIGGQYANLKIKFNSDFFIWLNTSSNFLNEFGNYDDDLKPIGFKLLRAERTLNDRSIICQGLVNSSYVIKNTGDGNYANQLSLDIDREKFNSDAKLPSLMRPYDSSVAQIRAMQNYHRLDNTTEVHLSQGNGIISPFSINTIYYGGHRNNGRSEIFDCSSNDDNRSVVYQFNQLMQLYSPESSFNFIQKLENTDINFVGALTNNFNALWGKIIEQDSRNVRIEGKIRGAVTPYSNNFTAIYTLPDGTPYDPSVPIPAPTLAEYNTYILDLQTAHDLEYGDAASEVPLYIPTYLEYSAIVTSYNSNAQGEGYEQIIGEIKVLCRWGLIGLGDGEHPQYQFYREYIGDYKYENNPLLKGIYGNPLIVNRGSGRTVYNRDSDLAFYNTYGIMNTDSGDESDNTPNNRISRVNSYGETCVLLALDGYDISTTNRTSLNVVFDYMSGHSYDPNNTILENNDGKVALLGEITIKKSGIYLGLLYGGNDYESRKRTNYIEIGKYIDLIPNLSDELNYFCKNPGDTFINNFNFTKIVKGDIETYSREVQQITEIVNFRVETTIDLKNRSDYSNEDWDSRFQPRYEEYQNYNKVYSQEPNFFIRKDVDYNFKAVSRFENGIISSKVKTPGETIDSWLSYQPNEVLYIDGKYGAINCLHSFKDEIYTLQDRAVAQISINPRVQVQADDGIAIQLGTGNVLDRYNYLSTMSGTLNKWSVVNSPNAFYYYDTLNKTINIFNNELTDAKGMHSYFINNTSDDLNINNPLIKKGITSTYDYLNNEVLFSFLQEDNNFTICYNENKNYFTSFYDFIPSIYISMGDLLLSTSSDNISLYKHGNGEYCEFYGVKYPSYIIYNVNPEPYFDCVFDNINYKSEVYLDGVDQPDVTLSRIQAFNDYQDSSLRPLINGRSGNLRRRFRDWNAEIPREGRNRIRGPWIKLKLQFDNEYNNKLILHDIIVSYTV